MHIQPFFGRHCVPFSKRTHPHLSSPHLGNSSKARRVDSVVALANAAATATAASQREVHIETWFVPVVNYSCF